jgi:hypothetical protein
MPLINNVLFLPLHNQDSIDEHNTYGTIDERVELDDVDDIKNDERWVSTVD